MGVMAAAEHGRPAGGGSPRLLPAAAVAGFPRLLGPFVGWLARRGVRPNAITATSMVVIVAAGALFGLGALRPGAVCLLASGLLDILDGAVARRAGSTSAFGAFLDSTLDRVGEAVVFVGIVVYFQTATGLAAPVFGVLAVLAQLGGSQLVSYTRARAESLGVHCGLGIAQRAERIVGIGVPTLCFGAGPHGYLLLGLMLVLALVSWATVVQRVVWVYRMTDGTGAAAPPGRPRAAPAPPEG